MPRELNPSKTNKPYFIKIGIVIGHSYNTTSQSRSPACDRY